jgi:hypothetical protein
MTVCALWSACICTQTSLKSPVDHRQRCDTHPQSLNLSRQCCLTLITLKPFPAFALLPPNTSANPQNASALATPSGVPQSSLRLSCAPRLDEHYASGFAIDKVWFVARVGDKFFPLIDEFSCMWFLSKEFRHVCWICTVAGIWARRHLVPPCLSFGRQRISMGTTAVSSSIC